MVELNVCIHGPCSFTANCCWPLLQSLIWCPRRLGDGGIYGNLSSPSPVGAYEKICSPPTECWLWLKGAAAHSRGQTHRVASTANIAVTRKHSLECWAKYRRYDITYYLMWRQWTCMHGKFQRNKNLRPALRNRETVCHRFTSKLFSKRWHFSLHPTSVPTAGQSVLASEVHRSLCQHLTKSPGGKKIMVNRHRVQLSQIKSL